MIKLDERGHQCPIPVINAKKQIEKSAKGEQITVIVDNIIAVQNLEKLAGQKQCTFSYEKKDDKTYEVLLIVNQDGNVEAGKAAEAAVVDCVDCSPKKTCVVISASTMGNGDDELGKLLMKSFVFAVTQLEPLPDRMLFYNGGAFLTCEGSVALEDLKNLSEAGVQISTCGTCLNHYKLTDKLAVGEVSNMYDIASAMAEADKILRP